MKTIFLITVLVLSIGSIIALITENIPLQLIVPIFVFIFGAGYVSRMITEDEVL